MRQEQNVIDSTESLSLIGEMVRAAMDEQGVSIKDLARKIDTTYEHTRRIVKGEGVPSKYVLKLICQELGIPYKEAERAATADRIKKRFGDIPLELSGKNPELEPIAHAWNHLSEDQKKDATSMIVTWAKRNKAMGKK